MANLTVTLTENVILNGSVRGSTNQLTITGIEQVMERIITIPANADTTILLTKGTVAGSDSAIDIQDTKYIRVTNLDSTNSVTLSLQIDAGEDDSSADESCSILLEPGKTFMMGTPHDAIAVSDSGPGIITALHDLESLLVDSGSTSGIQLEVFVASA
tara:strand:- start:854 stop:1327 length:474 start_codon:yes stop_codon:yes gene_type:complete